MRERETDQVLHLGEPSLDLAVPDELPPVPPLLALADRVVVLLLERAVPQEPDAEATARLGGVARDEGDGVEGGWGEGEEELCLGPRRAVEPLRGVREDGCQLCRGDGRSDCSRRRDRRQDNELGDEDEADEVGRATAVPRELRARQVSRIILPARRTKQGRTQSTDPAAVAELDDDARELLAVLALVELGRFKRRRVEHVVLLDCAGRLRRCWSGRRSLIAASHAGVHAGVRGGRRSGAVCARLKGSRGHRGLNGGRSGRYAQALRG